ncbi:BTAD domain-containing putative transcriptional regulator [uncultured Jatrophihabitans sp.]|uniref:BTAD domain-containing putative transcriptional regulator n=1 Tax=uncultured Jatrophihabitans sp. TaxID=1610747 RepID=UPI0035CA86E8
MQIAVLGPLEVLAETGAPIEVSGARVRTLLARLVVDAGRPVSVSALIDAVWGAHPPAEGANALQTLVSRLRRALGDPALITQSQAGYRLAAERSDVDAARFEQLLAAGAVSEALALWRGPAFGDVQDAGGAIHAAGARLADLRVSAVVDRVEADLDAGAPVLIPELEQLVAENPLHERLTGQLMRALAAGGRQADALRAFERLRAQLADELGVDPGGALRDIHLAVLRGELQAVAPARARRSNLKAQVSSFVGREDDVARIGKLLDQNRLVTLVGPGGAGKTRLAAEAAADVLDRCPDGAWLVELAPVTTSADVPQAVLGSLGLRETHLLERRGAISAQDATTRLTESLADRQLLVILDNCEHLIEASAHLADLLLARCPGLRVLTTSREPLGIVGETLFAVAPLGQPDATAAPAEAQTYPAVRLFVDRASSVRPEFVLDDTSVGDVVEIVRRLDGLPLAIELAAARLRTLPLPQIAERLSDRFRLLTGGSRTALPRHRTLRAVVEWSWDLLAADERNLAEQLSVFPSGITADSAGAVADLDELAVGDLLASLLDKSLLQPVDGGRRMRMLETIREFGADRLGERGALSAARQRHAAHFAEVLAEAEPHLIQADQLPWFALLADERDNILAAMRYRKDAGDLNGALRVALGLGIWAMLLGEHGEIANWLSDVLNAARVEDADVDPQLLLAVTALYVVNGSASGPPEGLVPNLPSRPDLARQMADLRPSGSPLVGLLRAAVAFFGGEEELAQRCIDELIESGDTWSRAAARMFAGGLAENAGDIDTLRTQTELALADFRELGERWGLTNVLRELGQLRAMDGDLDGAAAAYDEALRLAAEMKSREDEAFLLARLADVALRRGDVPSARRHMERAAVSAETRGAPAEELLMLALTIAVEEADGNVDEARRLGRAAVDRMAALPVPHPVQGHVHAVVLSIAARGAARDGDLVAAAGFLDRAFEAARGTRDQPFVASVGVAASAATAAAGAHEQAAQMLGAAARLRGADDPTAIDVRDMRQTLVPQLGEARFAEHYARGKALDRDTAVECLMTYPRPAG